MPMGPWRHKYQAILRVQIQALQDLPVLLEHFNNLLTQRHNSCLACLGA